MSEHQPEREPTTGDAQVDEALVLLDGLDDVAVDEHVARFEQVHGSLRAALNRPVDSPHETAAPPAGATAS